MSRPLLAAHTMSHRFDFRVSILTTHKANRSRREDELIELVRGKEQREKWPAHTNKSRSAFGRSFKRRLQSQSSGRNQANREMERADEQNSVRLLLTRKTRQFSKKKRTPGRADQWTRRSKHVSSVGGQAWHGIEEEGRGGGGRVECKQGKSTRQRCFPCKRLLEMKLINGGTNKSRSKNGIRWRDECKTLEPIVPGSLETNNRKAILR